jgi:single-strand DNA-binding protein
MLNRAILMGRLVSDPELRNTPSGVAVVQFRLAVDRDYTPKGHEKQTDFINCVAWRNTAEFVSKYFPKGSMIAIEGSLQSRGYTDKEGKSRTVFEVVADKVHFCGSKQNNGNQSKPAYSADDFEEIDIDSENLPF